MSPKLPKPLPVFPLAVLEFSQNRTCFLHSKLPKTELPIVLVPFQSAFLPSHRTDERNPGLHCCISALSPSPMPKHLQRKDIPIQGEHKFLVVVDITSIHGPPVFSVGGRLSRIGRILEQALHVYKSLNLWGHIHFPYHFPPSSVFLRPGVFGIYLLPQSKSHLVSRFNCKLVFSIFFPYQHVPSASPIQWDSQNLPPVPLCKCFIELWSVPLPSIRVNEVRDLLIYIFSISEFWFVNHIVDDARIYLCKFLYSLIIEYNIGARNCQVNVSQPPRRFLGNS